MSVQIFGAAGAPPPGVDALASLCTLCKRSMQATVGAPAWDNAGEYTATLAPFSYLGGDLSRELSNKGGFRERRC